MISQLKFNSVSDDLYFWTDLHYCHAKDFILNPRGFKDAEEHKAAIKKNWNETVPKNGIVFLLGDTVLGAGDKSFEVFGKLIEEDLNWKEIYIMQGNHGAGWNQWATHSLITQTIDKYGRLAGANLANVYFIPNYFEIRIDGKLFVLCHYPLISWNEQAKGSVHLHGHTHGNLFKVDWLKDNYYSKKVLDIGVERFNKPLSYKQILLEMDSKVCDTFDHH